MKYLFVFGNAPELAAAEVAAIDPKDSDDPQKLIKILGGTVKIAVRVGSVLAELSTLPKITFGFSWYGVRRDFSLEKNIKRELEEKGIKARFVLPQKNNVLSSVVVTKQKVSEIIFNKDGIYKTMAVQDFSEWNRRDYGRPEASGHIGMLPPKVARMMVNLAKAQIILDPFCGVGTIAAETLVLGKEAIAADINPDQVEKTKKNLAWLGISGYRVIQADARMISGLSVEAIVTEPDLGPRPGLEQLYLESLSNWRKILQPGGRVVIALPFIENVIDKAKVMGYSLEQGPFSYFRPQARVRRNIIVLRYGTH